MALGLHSSLVSDQSLGNLSVEELGDGAYSWHNWPLNLLDGSTIYFGSIATDGTKAVQAAEWDGAAVTSKDVRASAQDDDHNAPVFNLDPRDSDIIVVSTDHNDAGDAVELYKSTTGSVFNLAALVTLTRDSPTYSQIFRNPAALDQLDLIGRFRQVGAIPDNWTLSRSTNEFTADTEYILFRDHYVDCFPASDGSGIHVICHDIPLAGKSPTITHAFLRYSDDAVMGSGVAGIADFKTGTATYGNNGQSHNLILAASDTRAGPAWTFTTVGGSGTTTEKDGDYNVTWYDFENAYAYQDVTLDNTKSYVTSFWIKGSAEATIGVRIPGLTSGDDASGMTVTKTQPDGATSTFTSEDAGTTTGAAKVAVTTGWQRFTFPAQTGDVATKNRLLFECRDSVLDPDVPAGFELAVDKAQIQEGNASTSGIKTGSTGPNIGALPAIIADANDGGTYFRFLDAWQFESGYLDVVWAEFDGYAGCDHAGLNNQAACTYQYGRLNLSTYEMESTGTIVLTGDGLDTSSHTYVGGAALLAVGDVIIAQNNLAGDGLGRLLRCRGSASSWSAQTLRTSSDVIMRPVAVTEQTYVGSALRYNRPGDQFIFLEGTYTGYTAFNLTQYLATL
jgi:hypothetical protein